MNGLLLGLANGTACVAYCAPVLVPHIMSFDRGIKGSYFTMLEYLFGRLTGYLLFAVIAWRLGGLLEFSGVYREIIVGVTYLCLAMLLIYQGTIYGKHICTAVKAKRVLDKFKMNESGIRTLLLGFFTGINLCPPFMLAITGAAAEGSLLGSIMFFVLFFVGTSAYFIPLPLVGIMNGESVRTVGKMASVLVAAYYILSGFMMIIGGLEIL